MMKMLDLTCLCRRDATGSVIYDDDGDDDDDDDVAAAVGPKIIDALNQYFRSVQQLAKMGSTRSLERNVGKKRGRFILTCLGDQPPVLP